jgi:hypothetical protein
MSDRVIPGVTVVQCRTCQGFKILGDDTWVPGGDGFLERLKARARIVNPPPPPKLDEAERERLRRDEPMNPLLFWTVHTVEANPLQAAADPSWWGGGNPGIYRGTEPCRHEALRSRTAAVEGHEFTLEQCWSCGAITVRGSELWSYPAATDTSGLGRGLLYLAEVALRNREVMRQAMYGDVHGDDRWVVAEVPDFFHGQGW